MALNFFQPNIVLTLFNFFVKLSVKLAATFFFVLASMVESSLPAIDVGLTSDNSYGNTKIVS